jgi:hypothetical protein
MRNPMNLAALSVVLASCATVSPDRASHAHIFNLSTGEVAECIFQPARMGHSTITVGPTQSGESFTGEASAIDNQVHSSPYGSTSAFTPNSYTDTYLSASRDRNRTPGYRNERVILVGTRGTVVTIDYRIDPSGNGDGEGSDNNGVKYRLQFSRQ